MDVEERDQRAHKERGDDRTDAHRAEYLRDILTGDQQQNDADSHADKVADDTAERELDCALPL